MNSHSIANTKLRRLCMCDAECGLVKDPKDQVVGGK